MQPSRPHRLLVIDDHEPSRNLVARAFDAVGWAVTLLAAPPSPAAVAALAPDAVVLDYWFGREPLAIPFLEGLRAQPATARTPVLLVTAAVTAIKQDRERTERLANAVLFKPHGIWDLLAAVDGCRAAAGRPAPQPAPAG
jgi:DNA-binding response OmpR family regulator